MNKAPLTIYVLWHPDFEKGQQYANHIYSSFYRDINNPLKRGIGIPVYFRSKPFDNGQPKTIDLNEFENTAIIVIVNVDIIVDEAWQKYIEALITRINKTGSKKNIIYPVAVSDKDFKLGFAKKNFIRLFQETNPERNGFYLVNKVAHELCRLLYNRERVDAEVADQDLSPSPLKLFLSHAKADGEKLALKLRDRINSEYALKTFFDANDIAFGYDFYEEIKANIQQAAFLAIYTDKYSSSQWCIKEMLLAKKHNRPLIIVNSLSTVEERSFPYMGNVRNIRCDINTSSLEDMDHIIYEMMMETLRVKFTELNLAHLAMVFGKSIEPENHWVYPPELFSLSNPTSRSPRTILYPEPQLSMDEITVLQLADNQAQFITPTMLPLI